MPRFVARPIVVEAYRYDGHLHLMPEAVRLAVRRQLQGGEVDVMCGTELRRCSHGDWILRGPDGLFAVHRGAAFETMFAELPAPAEPLPAADANKPVTRGPQKPLNRKDFPNA